jgi:hypothetical protein
VGIAAADAHSVHDNQFEGQVHYANADFIGYFKLTWLHSVGHDMGEHRAKLAPLAPVQVLVRGRDVSHESAWAEMAR